MLRNSLITHLGRTGINAEVDVLLNGVYVEVEGVDVAPARGVILLELDQEALAEVFSRMARKDQR